VDRIGGYFAAQGVPFVRPQGGMFVWLDLGAFLPRIAAANGDAAAAATSTTDGGVRTWESERELSRVLREEHRLLFTPGEACHCPEPGYFRMCFAWMTQSVPALEETFRRLDKALSALRHA
jgi:aspartate/methionine/tyrosine aminotransferase